MLGWLFQRRKSRGQGADTSTVGVMSGASHGISSGTTHVSKQSVTPFKEHKEPGTQTFYRGTDDQESGETIALQTEAASDPTPMEVAHGFLQWAMRSEQLAGKWLTSEIIRSDLLWSFCDTSGWPRMPYRTFAHALGRVTAKRNRERRRDGQRVTWVEYFIPRS